MSSCNFSELFQRLVSKFLFSNSPIPMVLLDLILVFLMFSRVQVSPVTITTPVKQGSRVTVEIVRMAVPMMPINAVSQVVCR